ncbi:histidine phosphatase family protein [Microbacterium foliorum]|uniref:histidine phosphatase family protein n=1 Tax=Microbacterium foliorum TaxID=104336 RepID=UPI0028D26035|nr:histidine phosphatase family protein [Microbacterium foliorum]
MKRIIFVRHGETEQNRASVHQGAAIGGDLSVGGARDLRTLAEAIRVSDFRIDEVLVSPMKRCQNSFYALTPPLTASRARTVPSLSAKNSGSDSGLDRSTMQTRIRNSGLAIEDYKAPNGESTRDVQKRYLDALRGVQRSPATTSLVLAHGAGIASVLLHLTGNSFDKFEDYVPSPAGMAVVEEHDGHLEVVDYDVRPADSLATFERLGARI